MSMTQAQRELRKGSFRGVEFETTQTDLSVGRRVQVFEYPQRDKPFVEDMGRSARTIRFTAFVTGSDYIEKMNALIAALEKEGSGELIHPWLGSMSVIPQSASGVSYSSRLMVAQATLEFVESGESVYPSQEQDTGYFSKQLGDLLKDTAIADFAASFDLDGVQDFVSAAVAGELSTMLEIPGIETIGKMFDLSDSISDLAADALSLVSLDPTVLGTTIANTLGLSKFGTTVNNWRKVARQISRLTSGDDLSNGTTMRFVSGTTTEDVSKNVVALENLIRTVMVSNLVGASTIVGTSLDAGDGKESDRVMAYEDLVSVRDEILSAIDIELERATTDDLYQALEQSRSSVWEDMTTRAEENAHLIDYTPAEVMPSLVLAYEYYGDASREAEIVDRNGIEHPGFVPAVPLKILSV